MLGWEFPPFFAGGVGIVCYELTKAFKELNEDIEITYIMPFGPKNMKIGKTEFVDLIVADNQINNKKINFKLRIEKIDTIFQAYMTPEQYLTENKKKISEIENDTDQNGEKKLYGKNL